MKLSNIVCLLQTHVTPGGLRQLGRLSHLTDLDRDPMTDAGLEFLPIFPNLRSLVLNGTKLPLPPALRRATGFTENS